MAIATFGGGLSTPGTASRLSGVIQNQGLVIAPPGEWSIFSVPAANTQATVTKAAGGAGVRHILRSFCATFINQGASAATASAVVVRDGASGAGTILYAAGLDVQSVAGSFSVVSLSDLNLIGSLNTAMTVEFTVAGGTTVFETVCGSGYSTS